MRMKMRCGADPLVCRPTPSSAWWESLAEFEQRDQGVPRRPGGLPHNGGSVFQGSGYGLTLPQRFSHSHDSMLARALMRRSCVCLLAFTTFLAAGDLPKAAATLEEKCLKCHNPSVRMGGLSLASAADAQKGGAHGPA